MNTFLLFDMKTVCLVVGLLALMLCNILLGTARGALTGTFNWAKMLTGVAKAVVVGAALALLYCVGYFNADVIVVDIGGESVNLMAAVYLVALAAACAYAVQIVSKLKEMLAGALNEAAIMPGTVLGENETIDLGEIIKTELEHITAERDTKAVGEGAGDDEASN